MHFLNTFLYAYLCLLSALGCLEFHERNLQKEIINAGNQRETICTLFPYEKNIDYKKTYFLHQNTYIIHKSSEDTKNNVYYTGPLCPCVLTIFHDKKTHDMILFHVSIHSNIQHIVDIFSDNMSDENLEVYLLTWALDDKIFTEKYSKYPPYYFYHNDFIHKIKNTISECINISSEDKKDIYLGIANVNNCIKDIPIINHVLIKEGPNFNTYTPVLDDNLICLLSNIKEKSDFSATYLKQITLRFLIETYYYLIHSYHIHPEIMKLYQIIFTQGHPFLSSEHSFEEGVIKIIHTFNKEKNAYDHTGIHKIISLLTNNTVSSLDEEKINMLFHKQCYVKFCKLPAFKNLF
jgi:hypothetical protein